jgi:hypothetical protein
MAFMLNVTVFGDGFSFPSNPLATFFTVQLARCTFSFSRFYLAR